VGGENDFTLLSNGHLTGLASITAGDIHFLSAGTSGAITTTEPAVGNISKPILIGDSSSSGFFYNFRGISSGIVGSGTFLDGREQEITCADNVTIDWAAGASAYMTFEEML
jgi:hypothetical protein